MARVVDSAFAAAHHGIDEMREGVASTEVALGVADRALAASDQLLDRADRGLELAQEGVDAGSHLLKVVLIGAGVAVAVGIGVIAARRARGGNEATEVYYAGNPGGAGESDNAEANPA